MADEITVRPVETLDEARSAADLFDRVWGERRVIGTPLLWAMASHGGQVLAAFRGDELVGAQVGLIGLAEGTPALHSHITGVLTDVQHEGVGFLLKKAQREWCLERGIDRATWTFDPVVARNAYFNLTKLGAIAVRFHRDYYGEMQDAFNLGDRTDRLEVVWELGSERVRTALGLEKRKGSGVGIIIDAALVESVEGSPVTTRVDGSPDLVTIAVPEDYHALRAADPDRARAWRDAVGDALEATVGAGYRGISFDRRAGYIFRRS